MFEVMAIIIDATLDFSDHRAACSSNNVGKSAKKDKSSNPSTSQQLLQETYQPPTKRLHLDENVYDLLTLLQTSTCGKMVMAHFQTHACLNNNNELSNNINARMRTERIQFLSKEILKCFSSEVEVIWKGAYGNKPRRETSVGRGMLLQKYYSIRRKLQKCGVLRKELTHTAEDSVISENNVKPWRKVLDLWGITYTSRLQSLQKEILAVHDYMDMFPALKSINGYLLISMFMLEQYFEKMYPTSAIKLYAEWPTLSAFIQKKLTNKKDIKYINDSPTSVCK
ncbi:uncharacterized protein [Temnothorax nylanderi]|uniref:uncharacterized protein n=1 Tax=Temnothorax nylanderi TaxID=102681 RepID=UPI003A89DBF6